MKPISNYIAKTFAGLEDCALAELKQLGIVSAEKIKRGIRFTANDEQMFRVNYNARCILRVLREIDSFNIRTEADLYKGVRQIAWNEIMTYKQSFVVDKTVNSTIFNNTHFAALRAKDAVADFFRDRYGIRPSVNTDNPDIHLHVHVSDNRCTISADTSGEPLFKRGYRTTAVQAPINEILAAGILSISGLSESNSPLLDPMCGSGTFLIEAAFAKFKIPAAYKREKFGFMGLVGFNKKLWEQVKFESDNLINYSQDTVIRGADISSHAVKNARENIQNAGLSDYISVEIADFFEKTPENTNQNLIMNPPYDIRMQTEDINDFYKQIGDTLKQKYTGSTAYIISGNPEAFKHIGLRPEKRTPLYNGQIETELRKFSLYRLSDEKEQ